MHTLAEEKMVVNEERGEPRVSRVMVIGVDMGCVKAYIYWVFNGRLLTFMCLHHCVRTFMDECVAVAVAGGIHGHFSALRPLFFRLANLLSIPANFVFVFDGPNRPLNKRGKTINTNRTLSWVGLAKELIQIFGFHVHQVRLEPTFSNMQISGLINQYSTGK